MVKMMGRGDIKVKTNNGFVEKQFVKCWTITRKGYTNTISKGACEVYDLVKGVIVVVKKSSN